MDFGWLESMTALLAGAAGQLVDTTAGMGFGALASTLLTVAGVAPAAAVAAVNIAKVGSGVSAGISHWRFGNVRWAWVLPLAIPGVAGGVIGAFVLSNVSTAAARIAMPWLLLGIGVIILARFLRPEGSPVPPEVTGGSAVATIGGAPELADGQSLRRPFRLASHYSIHAIGFGAGVVNAMTGAYGPIATSLLLSTRRIRPRYVIGTVSLVEPIVAASVAAVLVASLRSIGLPWQLPVALVIGAAITSPIGALLARKLPARVMGIAVGVVMVGINAGILLAAAL